MTTDRELLERAAKAAGLTVLRCRLDDPMWHDMLLDMRPAFPQTAGWNPLTDDGDALRLAVVLGLTVCNDHESAGAVSCSRGLEEDFPTVYSGKPGDPPGITPSDYAATRRAIVMAAAAIGAES